ncbi:MAG: hypothetical protein RSG50_00770 [Clostridia bacterium]
MAQVDYSDNFIKLMLGWIRQVASSIAGTFQTASGTSSGSGGQTTLMWFTDNWIKLLIVLIVVGVLVDWTVWMLRWRPHWLWFGKRRIVLDDDIDAQLTEGELRERYGMRRAPRDEAPHFRSAALRRGDGADYADDAPEYEARYERDRRSDGADYADDADDADDADGADYLGYEEDEDDVGDAQGEAYEEKFTGRFSTYEALGEDAAGARRAGKADEMPLYGEEEQDDWADTPRKRKGHGFFRSKKRRMEEEDPFDVTGGVFDNLDDGFFEVVSEKPRPEMDAELRLEARVPGMDDAGAFEDGAFGDDEYGAGAFGDDEQDAGDFEDGAFEDDEQDAGDFEDDAFGDDEQDAGDFEDGAFEDGAQDAEGAPEEGTADLAPRSRKERRKMQGGKA